MDVRYINPFIVSCRKVFDTMVHMPVTIGKPYLRQGSGPRMMVSAVIGFGGAATGCVVLRLSPRVTMALASGIIGTPISVMDSDAIDAVGEIANMVAGHAKKDLPNGLATLSIPTVNLGDHAVHYPPGIPIIAIPCETPTGPFVIEVAVKPASVTSDTSEPDRAAETQPANPATPAANPPSPPAPPAAELPTPEPALSTT